MSKSEVTEQYDFDVRQTNYYTDAARYLGLMDRRTIGGETYYSISKTGRQIQKLGFRKRQLAYCDRILSHRVFHSALQLYLQRGVMPSREEIVTIMKESELYNIDSDNTYERRSSTVKGWLNWIVSLINE